MLELALVEESLTEQWGQLQHHLDDLQTNCQLLADEVTELTNGTGMCLVLL